MTKMERERERVKESDGGRQREGGRKRERGEREEESGGERARKELRHREIEVEREGE